MISMPDMQKLGPCPACLDFIKPCRCQQEQTFQAAIEASHPTRNNDYWDAEQMAMKLIGERHSKRDLVNLVRWLIVDRAELVNDLLKMVR